MKQARQEAFGFTTGPFTPHEEGEASVVSPFDWKPTGIFFEPAVEEFLLLTSVVLANEEFVRSPLPCALFKSWFFDMPVIRAQQTLTIRLRSRLGYSCNVHGAWLGERRT